MGPVKVVKILEHLEFPEARIKGILSLAVQERYVPTGDGIKGRARAFYAIYDNFLHAAPYSVAGGRTNIRKCRRR
jgi:hypothetical protein